MAISVTVAQAIKAVEDGSSFWVPEHEPFAHIVSQDELGFIALLGVEDLDFKSMMNKSNFKKVPALIPSEKSNSMKPEIEQYIPYATAFKANGAVGVFTAGTAQNLTLDSTAGLKKFDVLKNRRSGASVWVSAVSSATVVSVKGFAGGSNSGLDAIVDNDDFDLIGSAYNDGATFTTGLNQVPATAYNYMQFHNDEYGQGVLNQQQHQYPGETNQFDTARMLCRLNHNRKRELAFLFGDRVANEDVVSGSTVYAMHGLTGLSSRSFDAGGSLTWDEFTTVIHPEIAKFGGGDFHAMTGNLPLAVLSNLAQEMVRTTPKDMTWGNKVERIRAPLGDVVLHGTRPMNDRVGEMQFFQPQMLKRKYLGALNSVHVKNIGPRNAASTIHGYMTAETLVSRNSEVINEVTNVAA